MPVLNNAVADVGSRIFNERRSVERRRSFNGALLRFNGGYGALECVVRNFSAGGARLSFGEATAVPPRFEMRISQEGGWHPTAVKWRKGNEIGVAYESAKSFPRLGRAGARAGRRPILKHERAGG